jgi:hypothetical protein
VFDGDDGAGTDGYYKADPDMLVLTGRMSF